MIPSLSLKKILLTAKYSFLPALIFAGSLFGYCAEPNLAASRNLFFHYVFLTLIVANVLFLIAINRTKPMFVLIWLFAAYAGVNRLKELYGLETLNISVSALPTNIVLSFALTMFLLPLNWLYFLLRRDVKLKNILNFYNLCIVLVEFIIIENGAKFLPGGLLQNAEYFIWLSWGAAIVCILINLSLNPDIKTSGMFYALLCLMPFLFNPGSVTALTLSFASSALILLFVSVQAFVYGYFRDSLTGVWSKNSYYRHAQKSFPLKYSLGVVCIDDYNKLLKVFGEKGVNTLTRMVIAKIDESQTNASIYRYDSDEFILIFKNEDIKKSFEYLEKIRRSIAGAEFVLNRQTIVKITISAGISEKKRSDAGADAVLRRTREVLQKAYKFTQNVTSKA